MRTIIPEGLVLRQLSFEKASTVVGKMTRKERCSVRKREAMLRFREKRFFVRCAEAKGSSLAQVDYNHVLIDYRDGKNERIKCKVMSLKEAYQKNDLLKGSGFGWARVG